MCNECNSYYKKIYANYPKNCTGDNCAYIRSQDIYYSGPNLPNTGIQTEDNLTISLQKIDNKLSPENLIAYLVAILNANPTLKADFCAALGGCV